MPRELDLRRVGEELLDDLTCVTVREGRVGRVGRVQPLPPATACRAWIDNLGQAHATDFEVSLDGLAEDGRPLTEGWFTWFDASRHVAPGDEWMQAPSDGLVALAEHSAGLLSSAWVGAVVRHLASTRQLGESTWGDPSHRPTLQRVLDRLHLNYVAFGDATRRTGSFWGVDGEQANPRTVLAVAHPNNAWRALRQHLSPGQGALGALVGLRPPDTFSLPLCWREASTPGIVRGLELVVPSEPFHTTANVVRDVLGAGSTAEVATAVTAGLAALNPLTVPVSAVLAFASVQIGALRRGVDHWPEALDAAAGLEAPDAATILLQALRDTDIPDLLDKGNEVSELLLGLEPASLQTVEIALGAPRWVGLSQVQATPMVLLGGLPQRYGELFNGFGDGTDSLDYRVVDGQRQAERLFFEWWNGIRPTLDVALTIDMASLLFEQLLYLDDQVLAVNDLAVGEGLVASILRSMLADLGLDKVLDALGGASPAAALRYVVRQLLTDGFLRHVEENDLGEEGCMHQVFCWMRTQRRRDAIDAALGPVHAIDPDEEAPDGEDPTFGAEGIARLLRGAFDVSVVPLRGGFLPDPPAGQEGALRRVLDTFLAAEGDLAVFRDTVSGCDLGLVRDWLALSRADCLDGLRERFEPSWSDHVHTHPDVELPEDLDLPDRGPTSL